jgi:hypothetical protein
LDYHEEDSDEDEEYEYECDDDLFECEGSDDAGFMIRDDVGQAWVDCSRHDTTSEKQNTVPEPTPENLLPLSILNIKEVRRLFCTAGKSRTYRRTRMPKRPRIQV